MRRLLVLVAAICLASIPGLAEPKANTKAEAEKVIKTWEDAYNKKDSATIAALLTQDAVYITPSGATIEGRDKIRSHEEEVIKSFGASKITLEKFYPAGHSGWAIGRSVITDMAGKELHLHWGIGYVREGEHLKVKVLTVGLDVKPVLPTQPGSR